MNPVTKTFQYGGQTGHLKPAVSPGRLRGSARNGRNTSVLCTVVAEKTQRESKGLLPLARALTLKTYAVGKIPGGFSSVRAVPVKKETLTSRA